jgi:hypothetical protein
MNTFKSYYLDWKVGASVFYLPSCSLRCTVQNVGPCRHHCKAAQCLARFHKYGYHLACSFSKSPQFMHRT